MLPQYQYRVNKLRANEWTNSDNRGILAPFQLFPPNEGCPHIIPYLFTDAKPAKFTCVHT